MKLEYWDTIKVLWTFACGYVNGDMSGYEDSDIPHVESMMLDYPINEYVLEWKFDDGTEFAKCHISKIYGDCVTIDVFRFKD
jgi:hypothetical protein